MASEQESYNLRVVTLGAIKTGKSSILKVILFFTVRILTLLLSQFHFVFFFF